MPQKFNTREIVFRDPQKSGINKTANLKGTGAIGRIIPTLCEELIPNTSVRFTPNSLLRFAPLAVPLMSDLTLRHHTFAVPFRQVWNHWEDFITGGEFNTDNSVIPSFTMNDLWNWVDAVIRFDTLPLNSRVYSINVAARLRSLFLKFGYVGYFNKTYAPIFDAFTEELEAATSDAEIQNIVGRVFCTALNVLIGTHSPLAYLGFPTRDYTLYFMDENGTYSSTSCFIWNGTNMETHVISGIERTFWDDDTKYSELPLRALYRIWYYFYRDQNLDKVLITPKEIADHETSFLADQSNLDACTSMLLPRVVCWEKDIFNTATLQAYENNAVVPVSSVNDTSIIEKSEVPVWDAQNAEWRQMSVPSTWGSFLTPTGPNVSSPREYTSLIDPAPASAAISIMSLKNLQKIEALSKWLDKNLYCGWTYADQLASHFGVKYSDARMQLPEYLGGTKSVVQVETLTNATSTSEQEAGSQTAYAQGIAANDSVEYFAQEHCLIINIMSVVPKLTYLYPTSRSLLRQKKTDFAFPEFATLGSDMIGKMEVANNLQADNSLVNRQGFAYSDRYYDYKMSVDRVCGAMLTDLRHYYFAQDFGNPNTTMFGDPVNWTDKWDNVQNPVLSCEFVHCTPNTDMFVSDSPEYQFVFDMNNELKESIPLPTTMYV